MSNGAAIAHSTSQSQPQLQSSSSPSQLTQRSKKSHPTFHFLAGLASGVSSAVLLQPADLLKTRVQQSRSSSLVPVLRSILAGPAPVTTLWRGTVPSALRTGFGSALYFSTLNTLRQLVANSAGRGGQGTNALAHNAGLNTRSSSVLPKLSPTANLVTGATARVVAGLVLMPVTVIKVRYESDMYAYKSLLSAIRNIYTTEGIRGFFSGLGATAVRDAPYAGIYVVFYEAGKNWLGRVVGLNSDVDGRPSGSHSPALFINATSGVLAAMSATAVTNPFDAVKTRLQLMPKKYTNMVQAVRLMLLEEGPKSFFDGLGLRMARKAVSSALAWTVYEELIGRAERKLVQQETKAASAIV